MRQPTGGYRAGPASGRGAVAQQRAQKGADDLPLPYAVEAAGALCDEIKWNLEYIRNFFQNCGCTLSPSAFQIGKCNPVRGQSWTRHRVATYRAICELGAVRFHRQ